MKGKMAPGVASWEERAISGKDHSWCKGPVVKISVVCSRKKGKKSQRTKSIAVFVGQSLKQAFHNQQARQQDFPIRAAHRQGRSFADSGMFLLRRMSGMLFLSGRALPVLSDENRLSSSTS